jgi:dolichyl-phosphate-mannose--protein O-mannosyl transferase
MCVGGRYQQNGIFNMSYRAAALTFAGVMVGFKLWSVILIYVVAGGEGTTTFLLGTHVLWIVIPLALLWAPLMFWYRLYRVRRRRQTLLESEWNVHQEPPLKSDRSDS